MPLRINPLTGNFELVPLNSGGSGSGNVTGPGSSTDKGIVRWNGTTGQYVQDSIDTIQDGGAIEATAFMTKRSITTDIVIEDGFSWIAPSLELELSGSIELEPNGELIIV